MNNLANHVDTSLYKKGRWEPTSIEFLVTLVGITSAILAIVIFVLRAHYGMRIFEFGDETEKFVAAQMLNKGLKLYGDIFAHQGPLLYMLVQLYTKLISNTDFSHIRIISASLAVFSCLAIFMSPVFAKWSSKVWAIAIFLTMLSSLWTVQSLHMVLYHSIGGFLFTIVIALLVAPAILCGTVTRGGAFISGICMTLACFAAYPFSLSAILLVYGSALAIYVSSGSWRTLVRIGLFLMAGSILAVIIVTIWLWLHADITGYFIYHLYFNQKVYSQFISFSLTDVFRGLVLSFHPEFIVQSLYVIIQLICFCVLLIVATKKLSLRTRILHWLAILLTIFALLMLNPRGGNGFHNGAFLVASLGLFSILAAWLINLAIEHHRILLCYITVATVLSIIVTTELVSRSAISSPHRAMRDDLAHAHVELNPSKRPMFQLVRTLSSKDEPVLALIFVPIFYIQSERLPASGHYYYLPWQAAYAKEPILGHRIDICRDLREQRPPVVFFDDWKVWDRYLIEDYEPCVPDILKESYVQLSSYPSLYVRRDRLYENLSLGFSILPMASDERLKWLAAQSAKRIQIISNDTNQDCLVIPLKQGQEVGLSKCNDENFIWAIPQEEKRPALFNYESGLCADVGGGSMMSGTTILGWQCLGANNQLMTVESVGDGINLRFQHSGLCLLPQRQGGNTPKVIQGACPTDRATWLLR